MTEQVPSQFFIHYLSIFHRHGAKGLISCHQRERIRQSDEQMDRITGTVKAKHKTDAETDRKRQTREKNENRLIIVMVPVDVIHALLLGKIGHVTSSN